MIEIIAGPCPCCRKPTPVGQSGDALPLPDPTVCAACRAAWLARDAPHVVAWNEAALARHNEEDR